MCNLGPAFGCFLDEELECQQYNATSKIETVVGVESYTIRVELCKGFGKLARTESTRLPSL